MTTPEEKARERIDYQLNEAGWIIQNRDEINLAANDGVIIREFPLFGGEGFADYMIFVYHRFSRCLFGRFRPAGSVPSRHS